MLLLVSMSSGQLAIGRRDKPAPRSNLIESSRLLRDIEVLSADDMEGRSADRPAMQRAREYVERRFKESGLKPFGDSFAHEFKIEEKGKTGWLKGINIVGRIEGKRSPEKFIVITAHYDHVGVNNGEVYNGADDNASGTAALFAIAKYFSEHGPDHSLIFVAFDAEEKGLEGAKEFVQNPPVAKSSVLLNINMDMLSRNEKGELYASGAFHYTKLRPLLAAVQKKARVKLLLGHDAPNLGKDDWTFQSDHAAFHRAGIPFIYFGVEDHADYHRPTDDFANIMPDFYVRVVETIIDAVNIIDRDLNQLADSR
jgi:Zn-dependent M28 family amino/carboxypeptidase